VHEPMYLEAKAARISISLSVCDVLGEAVP
jgi:hypothetical protein